MQVVILSARSGWHTDELRRALAERGHVGQVVPYERLMARVGRRMPAGPEAPPDLAAAIQASVDEPLGPRRGQSLFAADAVLARIIPGGSLEQVIFRVDALHWLEERGIPVLNSPRTIERCVDKFYTTALLHEARLPTPETLVCESADDAMPAIRALLEAGSDVVIKPLFGSMGHGMVRVSDPDVAWRVVRTLEGIRAVFYLQRAVDHQGRDVRAFVVGGRVLGAIERTAVAGDWRANVARGAASRAIDLPPLWRELAIRAAATVGADYAGVDLLPAADGNVFVLEVNGIPGWQGLQRATGLDVAGAIIDHLAQRMVRRDAASVAPGAPV